MPRFSARRCHPELATTFRAGLDIDGEDTLQTLHPGHWSKGFVWFLFPGFTFRHDRRTMLAMWGEHAVESGEVESWARNQRGETSYEVQWIEEDMDGAVPEGLLELVDDLPAFVAREALISDRRPGNVTTEFFELVTLVGFAAGSAM